MGRDLEKDLIEIECAIKSQEEKDNTFTVSVLERCHELVSELKNYKDLEGQGKLLKLPCAVGDMVYCIYGRYTKCFEYGRRYSENECEGCPAKCDSREEYCIGPKKVQSLNWIVSNMVNELWGKLIFITKEEAKAALEALEG